MVEENMVNTLLAKVGLPGGGTLKEKILRLERMGYKVHGHTMDAPTEKHEVEKQLDAIPEGTIIKVNTQPYVAKRGRPKKGK